MHQNNSFVKKSQYDYLVGQLSDNRNITFKLVHNKSHNPNYTEDAVRYLDAYISEKNRLMKHKKLETLQQKREFLSKFDWSQMTEQDETVWESVFECLDN